MWYNFRMHAQTRTLLALAAFLASFGASAIEFAEPRNVPLLFDPYSLHGRVEKWRNERRPEIKKILEN